MLRQRRRGELVRDPEERDVLPLLVPHPRQGPLRRGRAHRGVLQPQTPPLNPGLPHPVASLDRTPRCPAGSMINNHKPCPENLTYPQQAQCFVGSCSESRRPGAPHQTSRLVRNTWTEVPWQMPTLPNNGALHPTRGRSDPSRGLTHPSHVPSLTIPSDRRQPCFGLTVGRDLASGPQAPAPGDHGALTNRGNTNDDGLRNLARGLDGGHGLAPDPHETDADLPHGYP